MPHSSLKAVYRRDFQWGLRLDLGGEKSQWNVESRSFQRGEQSTVKGTLNVTAEKWPFESVLHTPFGVFQRTVAGFGKSWEGMLQSGKKWGSTWRRRWDQAQWRLGTWGFGGDGKFGCTAAGAQRPGLAPGSGSLPVGPERGGTSETLYIRYLRSSWFITVVKLRLRSRNKSDFIVGALQNTRNC